MSYSKNNNMSGTPSSRVHNTPLHHHPHMSISQVHGGNFFLLCLALKHQVPAAEALRYHSDGSGGTEAERGQWTGALV